MRTASIFLSIFLHLVVLLGGAYTAKWNSRTVKANLGKPVYEVRVVKKAAPVKLQSMAPVRKTTPVKPIPQAKTKISSIKVPKPEPVAEKKPEKKEPTAEEVLAQAMKEARQQADQEKARDEAVVQQELANLKQELANLSSSGSSSGEDSGEGSGMAAILSNVLLAQVRSNWRYPVVGNQPNYMAKVQVTVDPAGEIISSKLLKSSGRADFDSSVLRAIRETERLEIAPPRSKTINLNFYLEELMQ